MVGGPETGWNGHGLLEGFGFTSSTPIACRLAEGSPSVDRLMQALVCNKAGEADASCAI